MMRLLWLNQSRAVSFLCVSNSTFFLASPPLADLNNVRFSAYRTAMKLRRLQKALCCEYSLSIYTFHVYMCHIGFLSLASSTLLFHHECSSHCVPALLHSSFVLSCLLSTCFFNSPHLQHCSSSLSSPLHFLLCEFFFPPPPPLRFPLSTSTIFAPLPSQSVYVRVHMCVYSSFSSLSSGSVECEPPTSCYVCDMFEGVWPAAAL